MPVQGTCGLTLTAEPLEASTDSAVRPQIVVFNSESKPLNATDNSQVIVFTGQHTKDRI